MLKRAALILLSALLSGCFGSQTSTLVQPSQELEGTRRIAVLPFRAQYGDGQAMGDAFVTEFMSAGFLVVERGLLEGVFRSLSLDFETGALRPEELVSVAKSAKVDAVIFGTLQAESEKVGGDLLSVSLRMVSAQSGEILLSSTYRNEKLLPANQIPGAMMKDIQKQLDSYHAKLAQDRRRAEKARKKAEAAAAKAKKAEEARLKKEAARAAEAARAKKAEETRLKKAAEEAVEAAKKAGAAPETPPPAPKAGKKAK